jgi:hypothetical protein
MSFIDSSHTRHVEALWICIDAASVWKLKEVLHTDDHFFPSSRPMLPRELGIFSTNPQLFILLVLYRFYYFKS